MGTAAINYSLRDPLGVVAFLSLWNLPLYLLSWTIAPVLAAGNTVIAKPSQLAPMTAYWLRRICMEAGLPPEVLNLVHGSGPSVGQALVAHPAIKAISFTGGTNTSAAIASVAAPQFKKLSLELGGKNPTIVFADCDRSKRSMGRCAPPSRTRARCTCAARGSSSNDRSTSRSSGSFGRGSRRFGWVTHSPMIPSEGRSSPRRIRASVWTRDLQRGHRIAQRLDSGVVWVNPWLLRDLRTPFGSMKHSGVGRQGGFETKWFFTEAKNVCIKL